MSKQNFKIITGNSHPKLVEAIAHHLGVNVADCQVTYFANGEARTVFKEGIRGFDVFVVQTGILTEKHTLNDHVLETLLLIGACKRAGVKSITLVMPHYPYARQDKKDSVRAGISASLMTNLYVTAGATALVSVDLHNACIQGFTSQPFHNLYASIVLKDYLQKELFYDKNYQQKFVAISPDEGGFKRANKYAELFKLPVLTLTKKRDYSKKNHVSKSIILGDTEKYLRGKTAIIIDDMVDTGGTMVSTVEELTKFGAKDVIVVVTHGLFSGPCLERMNNCEHISRIYTSDTVPQENNVKICPKIKVYSCSRLLATVIERLMTGESVSRLFEF